MTKLAASPQVPKLHGEITPVICENKNRFLLKMDMLGQDLGNIFEKSKRSEDIFNLQTTCNLGKQMIRIVRDVHK